MKRGLDDREVYERPRARTKHDPRPSQGSRIMGVSSPDDYIQNWLSKTIEEADGRPAEGLESDVQNPKSHYAAFQNSQGHHDIRPFLLEKEHASNEQRPRRQPEKWFNKSIDSGSDSSFLEPGLILDTLKGSYGKSTGVSKFKGSRLGMRYDEDQASSQPQGCLQGSMHLSTLQKAETFEKRKRHKTREDLYESVKKPRTAKVSPHKRPKQQKFKSRQKVARTGDDIMNKFSSRRVWHDRLTMQPLHSIGIFNKGRASIPMRNRGLPDLAFSEMDFLRRSSHQMIDEEEIVNVSRCREKEKRRAARVQNDISAYFNPTTIVASEVDIGKNKKIRRHADDSTGERGLKTTCKKFVGDYHGFNYSGLTCKYADIPCGGGVHSAKNITSRQLKMKQNIIEHSSQKGKICHKSSESVQSFNNTMGTREETSRVSPTSRFFRRSSNEIEIFDHKGIEMGAWRVVEMENEHPIKPKIPTRHGKATPDQEDVSPTSAQSTPAFCTNELNRLPTRKHVSVEALEPSKIWGKIDSRKLKATATECSNNEEARPRPSESINENFNSISQRHKLTDHDAEKGYTPRTQRANSRRTIAEAAYVHCQKDVAGSNISTRIDVAARSRTGSQPRSPANSTYSKKPTKNQMDSDEQISLIKCLPGHTIKKPSMHGPVREQQLQTPLINSNHDADSENSFEPEILPHTGNEAAVLGDNIAHFHSSVGPNANSIHGLGADTCNASVSERLDIVKPNRQLATEQTYQGLPVRGPSFGLFNDQARPNHFRSSAMMVEPLYSRQLDTQLMQDSANIEYIAAPLSRLIYEAVENQLTESMSNFDDAALDTLDDEEADRHVEFTETGPFQPSISSPLYQLDEALQEIGFMNAENTSWNSPSGIENSIVHLNSDVEPRPYQSVLHPNIGIPNYENNTHRNHFQVSENSTFQYVEEHQLAGFWRPHSLY